MAVMYDYCAKQTYVITRMQEGKSIRCTPKNTECEPFNFPKRTTCVLAVKNGVFLISDSLCLSGFHYGAVRYDGKVLCDLDTPFVYLTPDVMMASRVIHMADIEHKVEVTCYNIANEHEYRFHLYVPNFEKIESSTNTYYPLFHSMEDIAEAYWLTDTPDEMWFREKYFVLNYLAAVYYAIRYDYEQALMYFIRAKKIAQKKDVGTLFDRHQIEGLETNIQTLRNILSMSND